MEKENKKDADFAVYISLGMSFGVVFGIISNQLGLGISLGLFIGSAIYGIKMLFQKNKTRKQ